MLTDTEAIKTIAEEAYIMAYPMMENYKTMERSVGSSAPKGKPQPFNTLRSNSQLLGPEFTHIVAPNHDTVYSSTWLDLKQEPQVLTVPAVPDGRYYVFQLINMYNFNFGYIGARTIGYDGGNFLIVGPNWQDEIMNQVSGVYRSESRFAFLIGRTLINGPEDRPNVMKIQSGYRLQSLSRFLGKTTSSGSVETLPLEPFNEKKACSVEFINYFNFILGHAAIHPDDRERIESFATIGIKPGKPFNADSLPDEARQAIDHGVAAALDHIQQKVKDIGRKVNGWNILVDSHGPREVMAHRPLVNAAGAMAGLYGNDKEEASNFVGFFDVDGKELDTSENDYMIRFEKDQFPPVNAFWSITMYRLPEIQLVANPIQRYTISDRTRGLDFSEDGSLEILISKNSPGSGKESNWLPGPDGPFILALRNYLPDLKRFNRFQPPLIQRITPVN